jgi:hypothetical protein
MHSAALLLALVVGFPPPEAPGRFEQVPFGGDLDAVLKQLLAGADEENSLQRLLQQIRSHPELDHDAQAWIKKLDLHNPALRQHLRSLAGEVRAGQPLTLEHLRALEGRIALNEELMRLQRDGGWQIEPMPPAAMAPPSAPPPPEPDEDRLARWTRDVLEEVDQTTVGDFLRDSPAWQRGLEQLERSIHLPQGKFDWLGRIPENWRLPQGLAGRLGAWPMSRLPEFSLPRWRLSAPRFNLNLGLGGGPRLGGGPSFGGGSINDGLFWVLAALLLGLLAFFFYRQLGRSAAPALAARDLGPWPVDPARVSTRGELVRAFEYLARLILGDQVLTWNHRAVALKLGDAALPTAASGAAARELAELYELARYTPGDEALAAEHRTAARRHLLNLRALPRRDQT